MFQTILLLFLCNFIEVQAVADDTLRSGASGASVVEAVCSKIQSVCIFPDDKLMLRRIAFVETNDGLDASTYAAGYFGGIWRVDEVAFKATKTLNPEIYSSIQSSFSINWKDVTWQDLTKPFYSGLAARIFMHSLSDNLPRPVADQANFWATKYRKTGQASTYIQKVSTLKSDCNDLADVVFVVDGSGSIGSPNFLLVKSFLKNVTKSLNIGPDPKLNTRVSVLQFSNNIRLEFDFSAYSTAAGYDGAIDKIQYMGNGTRTSLALDYVADKSFLPSAGARGKEIPKIAIVLTDGASANSSKTIASADRVLAAKINVFAIGVGNALNAAELAAMASDPDCKHLFYLKNFEEFESLVDAIKKETCEVPVPLQIEEPQTLTIGAQTTKNFQIAIGTYGLTFVMTGTGHSWVYFSFSISVSASFYVSKYFVSHNSPAVVTFAATGFERILYGFIESSYCGVSSSLTITPVQNSINSCDPNPCACNEDCVSKNNNIGIACESFEEEIYIPVVKTTTTTTQKPAEKKTYNCNSKNPCRSISLFQFYPHDDPDKYVQCGLLSHCSVLSCKVGLIWNIFTNKCG